MILPDVNILIYAHNKGDARFHVANTWLRDSLSGSSQVCFCWETINGFVRISTNHRLDSPLRLTDAMTIVRAWLGSPNTVLLRQTDRHLEILAQVSSQANAIGPMFSDAVLASIAIEHNATLATTDSDFARFDGLKTLDPLDASSK